MRDVITAIAVALIIAVAIALVADAIRRRPPRLVPTPRVVIQFRRGLSVEWQRADPVLAVGEPGYETDTGILRIGDGRTRWTGLPPVTATGRPLRRRRNRYGQVRWE